VVDSCFLRASSGIYGMHYLRAIGYFSMSETSSALSGRLGREVLLSLVLLVVVLVDVSARYRAS